MNEDSLKLEVRIDVEKKGFCEYTGMNVFFMNEASCLCRGKNRRREKEFVLVHLH